MDESSVNQEQGAELHAGFEGTTQTTPFLPNSPLRASDIFCQKSATPWHSRIGKRCHF